jgi:uroporphyrinogen-III synthase
LSLKKPPCNLAGLSVLVTRPEQQSEGLCDLIQAAHGRPVRFPTIEILGPADKHAARAELGAASHADVLVFVSANAVQYAFPMLPEQLPLDIDIAAVGNATARALSGSGLDPTLVPKRMDSEGLLALPELQEVAGKTIYILRGNGGRELLSETLRERGAQVRQVEVYRRELPQRHAAAANLVRGWEHLVQVVIATSNAIVDNLYTLLGDEGAEYLRRTPIIVVSQRMAEHVIERGCEHVHVANSATDADLLTALCEVEGSLH